MQIINIIHCKLWFSSVGGILNVQVVPAIHSHPDCHAQWALPVVATLTSAYTVIRLFFWIAALNLLIGAQRDAFGACRCSTTAFPMS